MNLNTKLYQDIDDLFRQHDPMGLISMGAPPDEYESEAKLVYCEVLHSKFTTIDALRRMVFDIFKKMFSGYAGTEAGYQALAEDLFKLLQVN